MSNAILRLEFMAGTSIEKAASEAIDKAIALDLVVQFNFNGKILTAFQGNNVGEIVNRYHRELDNS